MKIGTLDTAERVVVVAEIGNNHEGNFDVAREMLRQAAEAGADAVKFQTFVPERFVAATETARLERLRGFQLSYAQFEQLSRLAGELGVVFFSTPLDIESARFLDGIQPVFKIASGDNNFLPLIREVAGFGKPMIVSTGLADLALLDRVRAEIAGIWARANRSPGLAFLQCVAAYPVPPEQAALGGIGVLRDRFPDCEIGYSDHTLGIDTAAHAVAAGARIIEKHFTLDKKYSDFRDHQLSADPDDLRELVRRVRAVTAMMGGGAKAPQRCEDDLQVAARRSIAAARDIPAGTVLSANDLTWLRPGSGLPPGEEERLIGHTAVQPIRAGELIQLSHVGADGARATR